ncbi:hypothetical protein [Anaerofustis stercorihominis]|uniref:hypothetical protein n=1 Tax=Anaerofustis stercorihominis TaxID=214853 RepID=UPI002672817A|nr:hypothetical protein [Anaerofustis stercorihominis]
MNDIIVIDKILNIYPSAYDDIFCRHKYNAILTENEDCTQWTTIKICSSPTCFNDDKIVKVTDVQEINPLDYITLSKLGKIKKITPIYIVSFREIDFKH